jgi:hypothetical protein
MQRVLRCLTGLIGVLVVSLTFLVAPRLMGQFAVLPAGIAASLRSRVA